MKSYKRTIVLLLLLLIGAQSFRVANKLEVQATEEQTTVGDAIINTQQAQTEESTSVQDPPASDTEQEQVVSAPETAAQNTTETDGNISLLSSEDFLTIHRNSDTTQSSEVESISLNHQDMENLIKEEYEKIRDKFTYSQITLQLSEDDQSFLLAMAGDAGESTTENIIDFLDLNHKFNDVHSLFTAGDVKVSQLA